MLRPARSALAGVTLALATTGLGRVMADKGRATSPPPVLSVATEAPDLGGLTEPVPIPDPPPSPEPPPATIRVRVAAVHRDVAEVLECIGRYESGGRYDAVSPHGDGGKYQFQMGTWRGAVARAGYPDWADTHPSEAPPEVQDAAAAQLLSERGLAPWPTPARYC